MVRYLLAVVLLASAAVCQDDVVPLSPPFPHDSGHAFTVAAPAGWRADGLTQADASLLDLLEDGTPLGPAHASHDQVRSQGAGAYSHWDATLWFSTSDNSDPNKNGRVYSVRQQAPLRRHPVLPQPDPFVLLPPRAAALGVGGRAGLGREPAEPAAGAPSLIWWYTIDALRTDTARELRADGSPLMPALAAFRAESVDFERAYAQSSFTKTSTASMFTGLWPQRHGVLHGVVPAFPEGAALVFDLDRRFTTLPELLIDRGYSTLTHLFTVHARPGDGMLQGFQRTDLRSDLAAPLSDLPQRLFVYEHILGLHGPYAPSPAARAQLALTVPVALDPASTDWFYRPLDEAQLAELREAYRGEAVDSDQQLGARLQWLRDSGRWDDALIIVTADHGEEFGEHGSTQHSVQLFDEVIRVPLLIKFPAQHRWAVRHGERMPVRVRLVDILPTLAELVAGGVAAVPYTLDGKSLAPILDGSETDPFGREVLARASFTTEREGSDAPALFVSDAVITGRLKAHLGFRIRSSQVPDGTAFQQGDTLELLYDVAADPGETDDLSARRADALQDLFDTLRSAFLPLLGPGQQRFGSGLPDGVDPDLLRRLRELGYVR